MWPGKLPVPGRVRCGCHSGKGWSWGGHRGAVPFPLRAELHKGAAVKKRGKKRDKNIHKVGSIIGRASRHSPVENSRSHSIPKWNLTLSLCSSLLLDPTICKVFDYNLTFLRTLCGIVNLDYRVMISSWFVAPTGGLFGITADDDGARVLIECWSDTHLCEAAWARRDRWVNETPVFF